MKHILRALIAFLIFAIAFVATARWIGEIDPFGEVPTVREKWAFYRQHKDDFDTLFIGTSRTYRGIKSSVFDQLNAASGMPTRTFNFGVDGMFPPEDGYVASRLLANPPKNLRWVFLEIGVFMEDFEDRDPDSIRSVYWHDWTHTWLATRAVLWPKQKEVKWKKWFERNKGKPSDAWVAWTHLRLFTAKSLNMGRGSGALGRLFLDQPFKMDVVGPLQDGYKPMAEPGLIGEAKATYEQRYAERLKEPARIIPMDPYSEENLKRTVDRIRALGAKPVLLLAPTTGHLRAHPRESLGVPVLDFCDIQGYPELFVPEVRVDIAHLNEKGAELFTRRVAEKLIELARSQGSPQAPNPSPSR